MTATQPRVHEPTEVAPTLDGPTPKVLGFTDQGALWANLGVSLLGFAGAFTVLSPRQPFTATPYSIHAADAAMALIGCGREGRADVEGTMAHSLARIVAVCDLDSRRAASAQAMITEFYKKKGESSVSVETYSNYHDVLSRSDVDAVIVSVPDHQHALVASSAAIAGTICAMRCG